MVVLVEVVAAVVKSTGGGGDDGVGGGGCGWYLVAIKGSYNFAQSKESVLIQMRWVQGIDGSKVEKVLVKLKRVNKTSKNRYGSTIDPKENGKSNLGGSNLIQMNAGNQ